MARPPGVKSGPVWPPTRPVQSWRRRVAQALRHPDLQTPFYLFDSRPVLETRDRLDDACRPLCIPVRHWYSCKTQPLPPLLRAWSGQGGSVEVVSEFELVTALNTGFAPDRILINGPAKQRWLPRYATRLQGTRVHFDSKSEAQTLVPIARRAGWSTGLRLLTPGEFDPETPEFPTQFGLDPGEARAVLASCHRAGLQPDSVHIHLRTNLPNPGLHAKAMREASTICNQLGWAPRILDLGGGFPPAHARTRNGPRLDATFKLEAWTLAVRKELPRFPGLQELWLENGRFLTADSGVLVTRILDVKERRGMRHLICDAGRTQTALVATWEDHDLLSLPNRSGPTTLTTVVGPTCMAFDKLARCQLPRSLRAGDRLVWMDAGAYHLPWETRFSHGWNAVAWVDPVTEKVQIVRTAEQPGSNADGWKSLR